MGNVRSKSNFVNHRSVVTFSMTPMKYLLYHVETKPRGKGSTGKHPRVTTRRARRGKGGHRGLLYGCSLFTSETTDCRDTVPGRPVTVRSTRGG